MTKYEIVEAELKRTHSVALALKKVCEVRKVNIRYNEEKAKDSVIKLKLHSKAGNILVSNDITTINALIDYIKSNGIMSIKGMTRSNAIHIFEAILDYFFQFLTAEEKENFIKESIGE